ncbi:TonB-dependent receptor domain-containing protein [Paenochrobactrum sp. BZR 588]|uniref:TonB-dependent receptor domain-containing protein n=1 Tax=unclassified Paenochrobactrum TaxID=2639760 RepID=UPI0038527634
MGHKTEALSVSQLLNPIKLRHLSRLACGTILAGTLLSLTVTANAQTAKKKPALTEEEIAQSLESGSGILLNQIVVTATGFEQNVKDAPASITVVPQEELKKGVFRNLTDALAGVQGVSVTGVANEEDIFIRGLPGAYTLILVDGKRQSTREARTNGNSGFEQSYMPPASAIERIEVVRGPMSSLYGSDAMGGVINIITKKVDDEWHGEVTVDGTLQKSDHGNSGQISFYANGPLVKDVVGLQVWGRGMKRNEDKIVGGTKEQRDGDLSGKLTITPNEDHDIIIKGGVSRLRREGQIGKSMADDGRSKNNYNDNDRDHWMISHTGRWGPTTSDFSFSQEWAKRTAYSQNTPNGAYEEDLRSPEVRNSVLDGKFTTPFEFYGQHTLVTGGQFIDSRLIDQNPGRRTGLDEKFSIQQWALFAEDEWWITPDFSLTGGLRMDDHEVYGSHLSPRAYAVWHATEQLTLKGGISTGFKAPEIRTIAPGYAYTTGGAGCYYGPEASLPEGKNPCGVIIGDGSLKAEKSTSYEFAALWDNQDGLQLGATYFYTDFKDKISNTQVLDSNGNPVRWSENQNYVLWKSFNIDNAVMQGVELTAQWEVTDDIRLRANYTYTHSRQKGGIFDGLPLTRTPEHMGNIRADWTTPVEGLSAWTVANYHGSEINAGSRIGGNGKPAAYDEKGNVIARKYDSYMTFDIGTTYEFNEHLTFNAAVYNMFDKKVGVDDFNTTLDGRRLWVSMTSKF